MAGWFEHFEQLLHTYDTEPYRNVSLVNHRGTVVAFALNAGRQVVYSVLAPGDASQGGDIEAHRWLTDPVPVPFPFEITTVGVGAGPAAVPGGTGAMTADAPFQVSSDNHHIYLFRQADGGGGLLADRFVVSGTELKATRETRDRRSKDANGVPYVEPTKQLDFVRGFGPGNFAVLVLPTAEAGIERWQIFAADGGSGTVRAYNLERSVNGLFGEASDVHEAQFELDGRALGAGLTARLYYEQSSADSTSPIAELGPHVGARVMLCAATAAGAGNPYLAAIDFGVSSAGHLAEIPTAAEAARQQAVKDFVHEQSERHKQLEEARDELARMEAQAVPTGRPLASFFTAEADEGFSFTLFVPGEDPDVHARYHTASRWVEDGPQATDAGELASGQIDRVRHVELGSGGLVAELYSEREFQGEMLRVMGSGPTPPDFDVRSIKVYEDEAVVAQREAIPDQRKKVDDLEKAAADAHDQHQQNHTETATEGDRKVRLPLIEPDGPGREEADAVIDQINRLQGEQPGLEREIEGLKLDLARLDAEVAQHQPQAQTVDSLTAEVAALETKVSQAEAELQRAQHEKSAAHAPRYVRLRGDRGTLVANVADGATKDLRGDRPGIVRVELDAGLVAVFRCRETHWYRSDDVYDWSTSQTTESLPDGSFEFVTVSAAQGLIDQRAKADDVFRRADQNLGDRRAELTQRRQALADARTAHDTVTQLQASHAWKSNELAAKERQLRETPSQLKELRSRRFGTPAPLPLIHHSTDRQGLTVRTGLLGFAWSDAQPVLFESGLGQLKLYFTGTDGQLFSARHDLQASPAVWRLAAGAGHVEFHARSSDAVHDDVSIRIGAGTQPSLCNVTIANLEDGVIEVWADLPRNPAQLCEAVNGTSDVAPVVVPVDRSQQRGSLLVTAKAVGATQLDNGAAVLSEKAVSPSWVADGPGTALFFDGESAVLHSADPGGVLHTGNITLESWAEPVEVKSEAHLICARSSVDAAEGEANYLLGLRQGPGNNSFKVFANVGGDEIESVDSFEAGSWHHIAAAYDQSYALRFAGNGHAEVPSSSVLNITGDLTIEMFLRLDTLGTRQGLLSKGRIGSEGGGVPYSLYVDAHGYLSFEEEVNQSSGSAPNSLSSTAAIETNRPTRIAVVRKRTGDNDEQVTFYIDGQQAGHFDVESDVARTNADPLYLAMCPGRYDGDAPLTGVISEVRLWGRALDADEIAETVPDARAGLNAWWKIDENTGVVAHDSVFGNHAQIHAGDWVKDPDPRASWRAMYVDGSAVGTTASSRPLQGDDQFSIGASKAGGSFGQHFQGTMDEVRVWETTRTGQQILDNLFARLDGDTQGMVAYYRFDHSEIDETVAITRATDSGPRGNHIEVVPSATPTEVLSTAPISVDAALVRCALAGIKTSFQVDRLTGRPSVSEYATLAPGARNRSSRAPKRCYGYVADDRWRLVTGYGLGNTGADWVAPAQLDTGATRAAGAGSTLTTGNTLLVPMYVKGIFADRPQKAAGPTVDFTYLPWNDGKRDHNADYAPLGEHLELPPMQNANGELQAGIHLHWTLPPALCRPIDAGEGKTLPYVPVRWEVCQIEGGDYAKTIWSDYLHPATTSINEDHVAIPIPDHADRRTEPPYRYMGVATQAGSRPDFQHRMRDFYQDFGPDGTPGHQHKLTSLGYGDPMLSSYYPNGREVFGHHVAKDGLAGGDQSVTTSSWLVYATLYDPGDPTSPLAELMADTGLSLADLLEQMGWAEHSSGIESIQLVGALELQHTAQQRVPVSDSALEFAMGNTGTEALSAHVAHHLGSSYGDASKIEEQLEAILMGNKVHGHAADLGHKFLEARHAQGYQSDPGGTRWSVVGPVEQAAALRDPLRQLNQAQEAADKLQRAMTTARRELFAGWYKYMLAKYPPPASGEQYDQTAYPTVGEAAAWLESAMAEIERANDRHATLQSTVHELETALRDGLAQADAGLTLISGPAERFHSPTDPVVLISGLQLPAPDPVASLAPTRADVFAPDAQSLLSAVDEAWGDEIFTRGTDWNPFIMEWQAEFLPLVDGTSKALPENRFTLNEFDVDADTRQAFGSPDPAPVLLQGRTFLSPGAKDRLEVTLSDYLIGALGTDTSQEGVGLVERARDYVASSQTPSDTNDAVLTACRALVSLQDQSVLSQSLGGFHDALIQRERHPQPNMSDPLGTPEEQSFTGAISNCVGGEARLAPNPTQPFLPVRAGSLRITGLRLIDVWGRFEDIVRDRQIEPIYAEPLKPFAHQPGWAGLRPRSVQPLRLNAQLLVAGSDDATVDDDPLASPVVGWLMANHLERSLMCFDSRGAAVGAYDREADFSSAPGLRATSPANPVVVVDDVSVEATAGERAMMHIHRHASGNPDWVRDFIGATDDALARIAPTDHLVHSGIAMLAGRPLAVVRARLSFELMGVPVQNQSWRLFEEQLKAHQAGQFDGRTRWHDMRLPVRLGSYQRLNDGLVGFWVEDAHGEHMGPFHSMAADGWSGEILGHDDPSALLWVPLNGDPVTVTMLIDPRGSVHAATGVLPMTEMKLRLSDFQASLRRLSTWYLQAPLLQPGASEGQPDQPVFFAAPPEEAGLSWRWLEAASDTNAEGGAAEWVEYRHFQPMRTSAHLGSPSELREGWLMLEHSTDGPQS